MEGKRLSVILSFLVVLVAGLQARTCYYFKRIPLQEGAAPRIFCIFIDQSNFIWVGTKDGLTRVDGQSSVCFEHDSNNPYSLPNGNMLRIVQDPLHRLWVLTEGGAACYRPGNNDFVTLKKPDGKSFNPSDVCNVRGGLLFIASDGIYLYSVSDGSLRRVCRPLRPYPSKARLEDYGGDAVFCFGTGMPVTEVDCHTWKTRPAPFARHMEVTRMFVDSKKRIWTASGTMSDQIRCSDASGRIIHSYALPKTQAGNIILCMAEYKGQILVGTDGSGVYQIDPLTNAITSLGHVSGDNLFSIPANSIFTINVDRYGSMWLGTVRYGLLRAYEVDIRTFYEVPFGNAHGLSNNTVQCLYEETPDRIWMGTDGGGIDLYTPSTDTFRHFPTTSDEKIVSICGLQPGKLLLKVFSRGLFTFDTATGQLAPFIIHDQQTTNELEEYTLSAEVHNLDDHNILMLSVHSAVFRYNLTTRQIVRMKWPDNMPYDGNKMCFIENDGRFTYLHDGLRLYRLDNKTMSINMICQFKGRRLEIHAVVRGARGNFWIGSNKGLSLYLTQKRRLIAMRSQLVKNVNALVDDSKGRLWVATDNMVFAFIRKSHKFMMFGETDGVLRNEFLPRVSMRTSDGDIYLAGASGVVHIGKDVFVDKVHPLRVQLSELTVNGKTVPGASGTAVPSLHTKWNSNVSLCVMCAESDQFRQKAYRFLISGYSDTYTESFSPSLNVRSLPAGNYDIMVSVMQPDGNWTSWQKVLDLHMKPPWYRNLWFVTFCVFLFLAGLFYISRLVLRNRNEHLKWELEERERQVNDDKMRFLVDITHELRTPLTLIHAPLDRLLKVMPTSNAYYSVLKGLQRQTVRMKHLINMVLDVHRMETMETRLHIQPYNLNEWLRRVADDFASEGAAQGITTVYDLDERIGLLSFDKDKCDMVLNNLLGNALKHSSTGEHIYVRTKMADDGTRVRISISDEGPGMKGVDPTRLFQRFYQGGKETVGSGIGLSYSKILVEQHGGSIGAYNNDTVGATFYFELPLTTEATEIVNEPHPYLSEMVSDESKDAKSERNANYDLSQYKLLVVDDNKALTDFLKDSLLGYFKQVNTASDGEEALASIRESMPDVVVSDVMMPRKDGFELCKEIKENVAISHIVVILLTARDDSQSQSIGYKNGADAYLTKPFEIDTLLELLSNRMRSREIARNRYMSAGRLPSLHQDTTFSSADETFMNNFDKFIACNLKETDIDIPTICREIGMSRSALYKKLKAITNMAPNEYITKYRMETAVKLMKNTQLTFADITDKVGISSSRYFSTLFKQYTGQTPTDYRKQLLHDSEADVGAES